MFDKDLITPLMDLLNLLNSSWKLFHHNYFSYG